MVQRLGEAAEGAKFAITENGVSCIAQMSIGVNIYGGIGYGAWSTGNITEEVVGEYLKLHKSSAYDTSRSQVQIGGFQSREIYELLVHSGLVLTTRFDESASAT